MGVTKHISIRVPEEIVIAADEVAKIKDRSRAYILVGVLQEWADKKDGGCMAVQKSSQVGGEGVLDVEEPVVRPKAQAASGQGNDGGRRRVVATGEDDGRGCPLCGGLNGLHQKGCKGR
jgi:hypothetical protein